MTDYHKQIDKIIADNKIPPKVTKYYRYTWEPEAIHTIPHLGENKIKVLKIFAWMSIFQFMFPFFALVGGVAYYMVLMGTDPATMYYQGHLSDKHAAIILSLVLAALFVTGELSMLIGDRVIDWLEE